MLIPLVIALQLSSAVIAAVLHLITFRGKGRGLLGIDVVDTGQPLPPKSTNTCSISLLDQKNGSGLGLATPKHIIAEHGGRVSARSEPGKGTRVSRLFQLAIGDSGRAYG